MGYTEKMTEDKIVLVTGAGGQLKKFVSPKRQLNNYASYHGFDFKFNDFDEFAEAVIERIHNLMESKRKSPWNFDSSKRS